MRRDRDSVPGGSDATQRELEFFDRHYSRRDYQPVGRCLRMNRDARLLLRESRGRLGRVVSYGCGDGGFEAMLAAVAEHVTGIDLSPEAIHLARDRAAEQGVSNVHFECCSAEDYAPPNSVDTVVCISFLHHLPRGVRGPFLERVRQQLSPEGLLYALEPNAGAPLRRIGRVGMGRAYDRYHSPDEVEFEPNEIRSELARAGFAAVELLPVDWTLIPATFLLAGSAAWPLRICAAFDRTLEAIAPARWATGFAAVARP